MCRQLQHDNLIELVDHVITERSQSEALLLFPYYQVRDYIIIGSVETVTFKSN